MIAERPVQVIDNSDAENDQKMEKVIIEPLIIEPLIFDPSLLPERLVATEIPKQEQQREIENQPNQMIEEDRVEVEKPKFDDLNSQPQAQMVEQPLAQTVYVPIKIDSDFSEIQGFPSLHSERSLYLKQTQELQPRYDYGPVLNEKSTLIDPDVRYPSLRQSMAS